MPKIKPTISIVVKNYVLEFGEDLFSCDESVLFCKLCDTKVNAERRYTVTHHIETASINGQLIKKIPPKLLHRNFR